MIRRSQPSRHIRVVVESAVIASGLTAAAVAALTLGVTADRFWGGTLGGFLAAFAIGLVLWAMRQPVIPNVDASPTEGRKAPPTPRGSTSWSVIWSIPAVAVAVTPALLTPPDLQSVAAGLYAAWAIREWRAWTAIRRYELTNQVCLVASGPFVPFRSRNFTAVRDGNADPSSDTLRSAAQR